MKNLLALIILGMGAVVGYLARGDLSRTGAVPVAASIPSAPSVKLVAWRDMLRPLDILPPRPEPSEPDRDIRNDGGFRSERDEPAPVEQDKPASADTEVRRWYSLPDHPGYFGSGPIRGGQLVVEFYSPGVPPALIPQAVSYPTGGQSGYVRQCGPAGCN